MAPSMVSAGPGVAMTAPNDPMLPLAPPSDPKRRVVPGSVMQRRVKCRGGAMWSDTWRRGWSGACHGGKNYDIGCHHCVDRNGVQGEILGVGVCEERKFGMSKAAAWLVSVDAIFGREGVPIGRIAASGPSLSPEGGPGGWDRGEVFVDWRGTRGGEGFAMCGCWQRETDTELCPVDADAEEFALWAL
eukprot:scaffold1120_cov127-Cylindrotheca_fusiformis.AAC.23